jgi:hypothetical protein
MPKPVRRPDLDHKDLIRMVELARKVIYYDQIAADEIEEMPGAPNRYGDMHDAEQALAKIVVRVERRLGLTPAKNNPMLVGSRRLV